MSDGRPLRAEKPAVARELVKRVLRLATAPEPTEVPVQVHWLVVDVQHRSQPRVGRVILSLDDGVPTPVQLEDTAHYSITRGILDCPERYWKHLAPDE